VHYYGGGHYTTLYMIDVPKLLETDWDTTVATSHFATLVDEKQCSKTANRQCSKTAKSNVAKRDATIPLKDAALAPRNPSATSVAVIDQPTDVAAAPLEPSVPIAGSKQRDSDDWFKDASECFNGLENTPKNKRLWDEVQAFLAKKYDGVSLDDLIEYSVHAFAGTKRSRFVIRSLAQLHQALVHGNPENGLYQQTAKHKHDQSDCPKCIAVAKSTNPATAARQALAYNSPKYRQMKRCVDCKTAPIEDGMYRCRKCSSQTDWLERGVNPYGHTWDKDRKTI
jgi:hypothetical protein